jgi:hypothetical protein
MRDDVLALELQGIRRTDSNSLLHLYDRVAEILHGTSSRKDRARADEAMRNIAAELATRSIPL